MGPLLPLITIALRVLAFRRECRELINLAFGVFYSCLGIAVVDSVSVEAAHPRSGAPELSQALRSSPHMLALLR